MAMSALLLPDHHQCMYLQPAVAQTCYVGFLNVCACVCVWRSCCRVSRFRVDAPRHGASRRDSSDADVRVVSRHTGSCDAKAGAEGPRDKDLS